VRRGSDEVEIQPVLGREEFLGMQRLLETVHVADPLMRYIVALVGATRSNPRLQVGSSPRGALALLKLSRGRAAMAGRDYVIPDDVKAVAVPALAHRLSLKPELWIQGSGTENVVRECLESVPTPSARELARER
jgi:MoxR-like ATPase